MWYLKLLEGTLDKISKLIHSETEPMMCIDRRISGNWSKRKSCKDALKIYGTRNKDFDNFDMEISKKFAACLRYVSKLL